MKCLVTIVLCLLACAGCSGWVVVISPSGLACSDDVEIIPSPTRPPVSRSITTGVTVHGTLSSCHLADEFHLVAVGDSTLVVRLRWNSSLHSTVSVVSVDGQEFRSRPPDWPPVVARVPVMEGQEYQLRVAVTSSAEIAEERYELLTALE